MMAAPEVVAIRMLVDGAVSTGHYRNPETPDTSLCGYPVVGGHVTTVNHVRCSLCFSRSSGTLRPRSTGTPPEQEEPTT